MKHTTNEGKNMRYIPVQLKTLLMGCVFAVSAQVAGAETVLRLAENQHETNPVTVAMHRFADLVEQYSDGEVKILVFSGAQLGQETENIEQAQAGIIDMARVNTVTLANVTPAVGAARTD